MAAFFAGALGCWATAAHGQSREANEQPQPETAAPPKAEPPAAKPMAEQIAEAFTPTGWPAAKRRADHVFSAQGPVSLPGLSHDRYTLNFEFLVATAEPIDSNSGFPLKERSFSYSARWLMEMPLIERVWFVGIMHDLAAANVPSSAATGGGSSWVLGNPELWLRGLWTSELGLSAGGGLSVVVPVPRTFSPLEAEVVRTLRVVRADHYAHFRDMTLTFRPYLDVRHVVGPVVLQVRQGLDVGLVARKELGDDSRYDLTAVTTVYAGVTAFDRVTFGLEALEVYQITANVASASCLEPCDEHRAQLSLSPSIRIKTPRLSPSLSVVFPLSTPLREEVSSFVAGRLNVDVGF